MTLTDKIKYKTTFKQALDNLANTLVSHVSTSEGDWSIKGFIDVYKNIYTISSDTKIISKILEIHLFPQIIEFAKSIDYKIVLAEKQNWYPDLTFINNHDNTVKFAVDIKTTFRRKNKIAGFTLGSHGAYFKERDKDKNIQFPYNQYSGHFCLAVIYTRTDIHGDIPEADILQVHDLQESYEPNRNTVGTRKITNVKNLKSITSVIKDFDIFAAEKWKIASDKQGSGNTANIGSIIEINDLKNENGIFSKLGEEWFDEYWINHGSARMIKKGKSVKITNLRDYLIFKGKEDLWEKVVGKKKKEKDK
ncbi:MAG: restriction endonuclease [Bacteroidetes bacterium]|nr:restriction endonuclease [Bacteroidota bacterium]